MIASQRLVKLADIGDGSFAALFQQILEQISPEDNAVVAIRAAMDGGVSLPPVFLVERKGKLTLLDGWQRCAAAALRGRAAIRAVVFKAASYEGCDRLSELLWTMEEQGAPWRKRAAAARQLAA